MSFNRPAYIKNIKEMTAQGLSENVKPEGNGGYSFRLTELGRRVAEMVNLVDFADTRNRKHLGLQCGLCEHEARLSRV